jgi:hypothetical protein
MITHLQQREKYIHLILLGTLQAFERMLIYINSRLLMRYLNRQIEG